MSMIAMCPSCNVPLVSTMAWPRAEFYCLDCGRHLGFMSPVGAEETPELLEDMESRRVEFEENAGSKLVGDFWLEDCDECDPGRSSYHSAHATAEDWEEHEQAIEWLEERKVA